MRSSRPYGLDYARWRVLAVLQEHSGATMGRTCRSDVRGPHHAHAHAWTDGKRERLIARQERESDRRSLMISLTPKGRRMFARILPLTLAETDRALTGFSSAEIGALRDRLKRIADNLTP